MSESSPNKSGSARKVAAATTAIFSIATGAVITLTDLLEIAAGYVLDREVVYEEFDIVETEEVTEDNARLRTSYLNISAYLMNWPRDGVDFHSSSIANAEEYEFIEGRTESLQLAGAGIAGPIGISLPLPFAASDGVPAIVCQAQKYVDSIDIWLGEIYMVRQDGYGGEALSGEGMEQRLNTPSGLSLLKSIAPNHDIMAMKEVSARPVTLNRFFHFGERPCGEERLAKARVI